MHFTAAEFRGKIRHARIRPGINQGVFRVESLRFFGHQGGGFLVPVSLRQRVEGQPPDAPADNFSVGLNRQWGKAPALKGAIHGSGYIAKGIYQGTIQIEDYTAVFHEFIMLDIVGTYYHALQKNK
jgi:hypothetical protein